MYYIILNDSVCEQLQEQYHRACEGYGIDIAFDSYIQELFTYNGRVCLYNRSQEDKSFWLPGHQGMLKAERHNRYPNCLYARKLVAYDRPEAMDYRLTQSVVLPGEWLLVKASESSRIKSCEAKELEEILGGCKGSYQEYYAFKEQWERWDVYHQKLQELTEQQERLSESKINRITLENNIFTIYPISWKEQYRKEACAVLLTGDGREQRLGEISAADSRSGFFQVCCEEEAFINQYLKKQTPVFTGIRIADYGTRVRLRRQREALRKLFQEETANPHLKGILMGEYDSQRIVPSMEGLEKYLERFGENAEQAQSFIGAVNAPDMYLIQGPPGTGKTTVITELVKYAVDSGQKVLVSSETNVAVDNVLERVQDMEKVVSIRLGREEAMSEYGKRCTLDNRMEEIACQVRRKQEEYRHPQYDVDRLIENMRRQKEEQLARLEQEMQKHRSRIPVKAYSEELEQRLDRFLALLTEVKELEGCCRQAEQQELGLQIRYQQLSREKAVCDADITVSRDRMFDTGIAEIEKSGQREMNFRQQESERLEEELCQIKQQLLKVNYQRARMRYERGQRKLNREKEELLGCIQEGESFGQFMYHAQRELEIIGQLRQRRQRIQENLESELEQIRQDAGRRLRLLEETRDIRQEWVQMVGSEETRQEIEAIYLRRANVVCATCSGIASGENRSFGVKEYNYVIIDEAAKCNTLDMLIPMTMGKKLILVGDHKQLYPILETEKLAEKFSEEEKRKLKEQVLFKWLYEERMAAEYRSMLLLQYRMKLVIASFVSSTFYEGRLVTAENRQRSTLGEAMVWIDSRHCEESREEQDTSLCNPGEAQLVLQVLDRLEAACEAGTSVGIISLYKSQAEEINRLLAQREYSCLVIECSTVDAFQGKEKQIIVLDLVRSRAVTSFQRDENRVNVAVSRAREQLWVIGSVPLYQQSAAGVLNELYEYIRVHGEVKDGSKMGCHAGRMK